MATLCLVSTRDRVIVNFHPCVLLQVMKRIVEEYGGDLVVATLCLVETSRFGLLETELLDLLAIQPITPGAKNVENLAVGGKLLMAKVD